MTVDEAIAFTHYFCDTDTKERAFEAASVLAVEVKRMRDELRRLWDVVDDCDKDIIETFIGEVK